MIQHQPTETIEPTDIDILCGRGKAYAKHPGNVKFTRTIEANLQKYRDAPKRIDRSIVLASLTDQFLEKGCRFLKKDKVTNGWFELAADQCHEKVGHALRDLNRKKRNSLQTMSSSAIANYNGQKNHQISQTNWNLILNPLNSFSDLFPNETTSENPRPTESTALSRLIQCALEEEDENFGNYGHELTETPIAPCVTPDHIESFAFRASADFNSFTNRHDLSMEESLYDFRF